MHHLLVMLAANRNRCGGITLVDAVGRKICGPFPVAARSSGPLAAANGNAKRDPLLRYGDTPTGTYAVRQILASGKGTRFSKSEFGPHGVVVLDPLSGDAACAEANGRFHFFIAAGDLSTTQQLRSTAGSLRLHNEDMHVLSKALRELARVSCEIVERDRLPDRGSVFIDPACLEIDPLEVSGLSESPKILRDGFLGSAAGAMAFGLAVTFTCAPGSQPARASTLSVAAPDDRKAFITPEVAKPNSYVRMAYQAPGPAPASNTLNIDAFVSKMDADSAQSAFIRHGNCAHACRDALVAGGLKDAANVIGDARTYGTALEKLGFKEVGSATGVDPPANFKPEPGDVAVFAGNNDHHSGHVQVWDGTRWVADFKNRVGKYSPYGTDTQTPPSKIYRFHRGH